MLHCYAQFFENQHKLPISRLQLEVFLKYVRELRNVCAEGGLQAQSDIVNTPGLVEYCCAILEKLHSCNDNELSFKSLQVGIQFIGNLIVGHASNKAYIWMKYFSLLRTLILHENKAIRNCTEMVIYNLVLDISDVEKCLLQDNQVVVQLILDASDGQEFASFLLESLIKNNLGNICHEISVAHRIKLIQIVTKCVTENPKCLSSESVTFIKEMVKDVLDKIIQLSEVSYDDSKEIIEWLNLLSTISYIVQHQSMLQNDLTFITHLLKRLCELHKLGCEYKNMFTPYSKLEVLGSPELPNHPLYGTKTFLIRIIGNLSYRNKIVQDKVRELNGIYVILDCCKYDAKNPYIMQWAILAVSNLCYNNTENQEIIKTLSAGPKSEERYLQENENSYHPLFSLNETS